MNFKRNPILTVEALKSLRISPSSLNSFFGCPRRWFQEYVKALTTKTTIHLIRGNIVHKTLEDVFKTRFYPSGESFRPAIMKKAIGIFEHYWKVDFKDFEFDKEDTEQETRFYDESKFMVERFANKFCNNIQDGIKAKKFSSESQGYYYTRPTFKELWIDDQFKINFNDKWKKVKSEDKVPMKNSLTVGGFIDSVQKNFNNDIILVDYKTSSKYKNVFSEEYMLQLGIYAYLWQKQTGKLPKYVAVNYLKYDESYYLLVTPSLVKEAVTKIKLMRTLLTEFGLDEEKYYKKETKLCDWCSFQDKCMGTKDGSN